MFMCKGFESERASEWVVECDCVTHIRRRDDILLASVVQVKLIQKRRARVREHTLLCGEVFHPLPVALASLGGNAYFRLKKEKGGKQKSNNQTNREQTRKLQKKKKEKEKKDGWSFFVSHSDSPQKSLK